MGVGDVVGQRHHDDIARSVLRPVVPTAKIKLELGQEGDPCIVQHPHLDSSLDRLR